LLSRKENCWSLTLKDKYVGTLEFAPIGVIADTINDFSKQIICRENEEWFFINLLSVVKSNFSVLHKMVYLDLQVLAVNFA
jgi:hypothetical protein